MDNKIKILLVEDDFDHIELIKRNLEDFSEFEISITNSIKEAKDRLKQNNIDLIISDWRLPDGTGTEIVQKENYGVKHPIILMTSFGNEKLVVEAFKSGIMNYVVKSPESFQNLPHIIYQTLREWENTTARRSAEQALKASEEKFRSLTELNPVAILIYKKGKFEYINRSAVEYTGYSKEEFSSISLYDFIHPDFKTTIEQHIETISNETNIKPIVEAKIITKGKTEKWARIVFDSMVFEGENSLIIAFEDVTEKKIAEEALRESERRFRDLTNLLPVTVFEWDLDGKITFSNKCGFDTFRFNEEDIKKGINVLSVLIESDRAVAYQRLKETYAKNVLSISCNEYHAITKKGDLLNILSYVSPTIFNNQIIGFRGTVINITDRKKAEEAIRASEERFRALIENSSDVIVILNEKGLASFHSPSVEKVLGYTVADINNTSIFDYIHKEDTKKQKEYFIVILKAPGSSFTSQFRLRHKDGSWRWVEGTATNHLDHPGVNGIVINYRDVTQQVEAREALKRSEADYRGLFENAHDAIVIFDPYTEEILEANSQTCELYGFSREELIGLSLETLSKDILQGKQYIKETLNKGVCYSYETIQFNRSGQEMVLEVNSAIIDFKGKEAILSINRNITSRKLAEESLQASERRYRIISEQTGQLVYDYDIQSGSIQWAGAIEQVTGYSTDDFQKISIGQWNEMIHPDDYQTVIDSLSNCINTNSKYNSEYRYRRSDGQYIYVEDNGILIEDNKDNSIHLLGTVKDISDRKKTEKALHDSEEMFRALAENSSDVIMRFDKKLRHIYVNPMTEKQLNIPCSLYIGKTHQEMGFDEDFTKKSENAIELVFKSKKTYRIELYLPNGIWVDWILTPEFDENGNVIAVTTTARDISDIKRMMETVEETKDALLTVFDSVNDAIIIHDIKGEIIDINKKMLSMYNFTREEAFHCAMPDLIVGDDQFFELDVLWDRTLAGEELLFECKAIRPKDLFEFDIEMYITRIKLKSEYFILCSIKDITERKKNEIAIIESEEKFRTLFDQSPDSILLVELDDDNNIFTIVDANEATSLMHGYSIDQIIGQHITFLDAPDDALKAIEMLTVLPREKMLHYEIRHKKADGTIFPVEVYARIVEIGGRILSLAIDRDITERKASESEIRQLNEDLEQKVVERTEQLKDALEELKYSNNELRDLNVAISEESQKLIRLNDKLAFSELNLKEALATKDKFFSIIAHDLRNPIGSFGQLTELLTVYHKNMTQEEINKIIISLDKSAKFTFELLTNLLEWSRSQTGRIEFLPQMTDLKDVIDRVFSIFKINAENKNIKLISGIEEELFAYFDKNMIITVFRNLVSNAIKFTNEFGEIRVKAATNDDYVEISIQDTGVGMDNDLMTKLFRIETKVTNPGTANEKGTGLGLILCKEFVERHGGRIGVYSEQNHGSCFTITLPLKSMDNISEG